MTAFSDETGRDWLPLKYEDGPDFCTVTLATGAAFALTVHPERMKLMEAALSASPVAQEPVAWQFMASDDVVLSTTADKRVVKQWEQSGYHVRPLYTYPPAPAVGAEDVARLIDPMAFKSWHGLYDYCIRDGADDAFARRCADSTHKANCDAALAKADAILSLLSGQGERKSKS